MEEALLKRLTCLWDDYHTNSREVSKIFSNYFGEENVDYQEVNPQYLLGEDLGLRFVNLDLPDETIKQNYNLTVNTIYQGGSRQKYYPAIIIHFPKVIVTNEYDKSVEITHFYVKVVVLPDGRLVSRFTCSRSEYPFSQLVSDYMHSHCSHIPVGEGSPWVTACTGGNDTPINRTMATLTARYDPLIWRMFCCELNSFTQVESVAGTPYRRLEEIGAGRYEVESNRLFVTRKQYMRIAMIRDFIDYYVENNNLKFEFSCNSFTLGMSLLDYRFDISNAFITWFNLPENPYNKIISVATLKSEEIISTYKVSQSKIYVMSESYNGMSTSQLMNYDNANLFKFKGEMVKVHIIMDDNDDSDNCYTLVTPSLACYVLTAILDIINLNYGTNSTECNTSATEAGRRRLYL